MIDGQLDVFAAAGATPPARTIPADPRMQALRAAWLLSYTSPNTRRAYGRDLDAWLAFCAEHDVDPLAARRVHVDGWRRAGTGYTRPPADTSIARRLAAVSSFYAYLVAEDVTDVNPARHVARPRVDPDYSPTRGLSRDEASALLLRSHRAGRRPAAIVAMLLLDGLRVAELVAANVDDLATDRGHRTLDVVRKGGRRRRVAIAPAGWYLLDRYLGGRDTGPLLVTRTGRRLTAAGAFRDVRAAAAAAGLDNPDTVTPHTLRHAFATLALDAGVPLRDVQDAMDHRDPRTTRRYDRARGMLDRHPAYALSAHLAPPGAS